MQQAESTSESAFFALVETSLLFFALTAYFSAKYTRNRTTTISEIVFSIYSTVHAKRMLKFLVQQENSDQQCTRRAERTPESTLLAQAKTSVIYLTLTACFSDKYTSDGPTMLVEISTTLHLQCSNY